jgi:predicted nucleic acid-binding protein
MDLWDSGLGILSTQVLQEFFVNITKKVSKPLEAKLAKDIIRDLLKWEVVIIDGESLLEAIEVYLRHKYSFWDSMILQAAQKGGASLLLSEDLPDGQMVAAVKIKNPFIQIPF